MKIPATLAAALLAATAATAVEIQGVKIPPTVEVAGKTLQLNGAGLRTFTLVFVPIKIYVAALHSPAPLRSADAVNASTGPLQFTFTFLRDVGQGDVTEAWQKQFAASNTHTYAGYEKDRDAFIAMLGPIQSGGAETVQLVGTDTIVIDQGKMKGTIPGRNFQQSFLSLWFGSDPVSDDLKAALLGQ